MRKNYTTKILVVDVESTCWNRTPPKGEVSEIIEIGICPIDVREMVIEEPELYYISPQHSHISEFCTSITGTTEEEIRRLGIPFGVVLDAIEIKHDAKYRCLASWGDYDRDMFYSTCNLYGEQYPFSKTHINIKYLFSLMTKKSDGCGLLKAVNHLGLEFSGKQHRADCDAYNTAVIMMKIVESMRVGKAGACWIPREIDWKERA